MKPSRDIEKRIRGIYNHRFQVKTSENLDRKVLTNSLNALDELQMKNSAQTQPNIWRIIMKNRTTKFAAALVTVLLIGSFAYFFLIKGPDIAGVAWAQVAQQVEQARTIIFRMKMETAGLNMTEQGTMAPDSSKVKTREMEATIMTSAEYGTKMEMFSRGKLQQQMYILPREGIMLTVIPEARKYMRIELTNKLLAETKKNTKDPRDMVREFMQSEYTELGQDTIDGIAVEGIEVTDPRIFGGMFEKVVARLWVDLESGWPVLIDMDGDMAEGSVKMHMMMYDFQWSIDIDPGELEPIIPEDYTAMPPVKMPGMDIDSALQGLRKFVELTGHFPRKLNHMSIMKELSENVKFDKDKIMQEEGVTEEEMKNPDYQPSDAMMKRITDIMNDIMPVQAVGMFYMKLVQEEKDPVYYGETVSPDDVDAVLLRWRVGDNEYQVIFGDLTTETVSADRLAELEK